MEFPRDLGVIACNCVIRGEKSVNFVSHASGDWQMYCDETTHDFEDPAVIEHELHVVHVWHLIERDDSLRELAGLPVDMGAERPGPGVAWVWFEDVD